MQFRGLFLLGCLGVAPLLAIADEAPPPPPMDVWTGKGQLGFVESQGNTDSKSANAAIDMARYDGDWKHTLHLGGLYGESAGITSAERWDALWQSNYDFTKDFFGFGGLRYAHDEFSGFAYQASITAGVGYKLLNTDATKLSVQLGAGYREARPEELTKDAAGAVVARTLEDKTGNAIATAGLDYSQALTATTTLSDKLLVEAGSSDTLINDTLALTVKISTKLALSLGYSLQDNTKPPAGLKKIDTTETLNLVYGF
jgi:putative salt-induced outer membrane protein